MKAEDVIAAIKRRYVPDAQVPEFVVLEQVRNQQGFGYSSGTPVRTFDALMVGLWESRGHPVHGFEVKVSKGDWKRELVAPDKADPLVKHVNFWWIAAPAGIVDPATLPDGWGLQVLDGERMRTVRDATRRDALPPSWSMTAAILKRAAEQVTGESRLRAEYQRGQVNGRESADESWKARVAEYVREAAECRARERAFADAAGVSLGYGTERAAEVGKALRIVLGGHSSPTQHIETMRRAAQRFLEETAA